MTAEVELKPSSNGVAKDTEHVVGDVVEIGIVGPGIEAAKEEIEKAGPVGKTALNPNVMDKIPLTDEIKKDYTPVHLVFKDLTVSVENGARKILQNVSGEVKPGEVLAIMGPSGAGKTTLLSILAGRAHSTGGKIEGGNVTINGSRITKRMRRKVGFVLQEDTFFTHLTMRQTLQFAAELRLPETYTKQQKIAKVDEISDVLNIQKCQNTIMGGGFFVRGISGGMYGPDCHGFHMCEETTAKRPLKANDETLY